MFIFYLYSTGQTKYPPITILTLSKISNCFNTKIAIKSLRTLKQLCCKTHGLVRVRVGFITKQTWEREGRKVNLGQ